MSSPVSLSGLQEAINTQLSSLDIFGNDVVAIVNADEKDLDTRIAQVLGEIGLMILIGQPKLKSQETERPESNPLNAQFEIEIAIGENPVINRAGDPGDYVVCMDAMMATAQRLHGFVISGWKQLAVESADPLRDKKRQIYQLKVVTEKVLPPI